MFLSPVTPSPAQLPSPNPECGRLLYLLLNYDFTSTPSSVLSALPPPSLLITELSAYCVETKLEPEEPKGNWAASVLQGRLD